MIWYEAAAELRYPSGLEPIAARAVQLDDWNENWSAPWDEITSEVVHAVHELLRNRAASAPGH
ncbi:hypothetical protein [Actinacidiphila sp. bgisy160]|uniref:hypothetical protein n=1 Tax=Actinacidiphila sp. bgisy160 TaxID=3413796 RepID=UPI003D759988